MKSEVDCSGRQGKFWLVKVPKYVSEEWQRQGPGAVVGKLKVRLFSSLPTPNLNSII